MLQISDTLISQFYEANEKANIVEFLNKKQFTASDTPLSYRQINTLDEDKLLDNSRKNKKGWRKFSFKELIYILIVAEVKKFGVKHEQLHKLWHAFFGDQEDHKGYAELALGCVFGHTQIILTVDSAGDVVFYDPNSYILFSSWEHKPLLTLELNSFVNSLLNGIRRNSFIPKFTVFSESFKRSEQILKPKEEELLKIIRDEQFSAIRIKKKNGEIEVVYAEKTKNAGNFTPQELLEIIHKKDFQDISIVQRDGKIVNLKVEEAYKL